MIKTSYHTIKDYVSTFPEDTQKVLKKIWQEIKKAAPDATEGISYGIPTFYLNGKYLVYLGGFENHVSVYPATTKAVEKSELTDFKVSKGTLKFPLDKTIPYELIGKFVKERVKETDLNRKNN